VASRVETGANNVDLGSLRDDELNKINEEANINYSQIKARIEMSVKNSQENPCNTSLVEDVRNS